MRNPLTAALAAMALHAACALAAGWPYPSLATAVAGILAVAFAVGGAVPPRAMTGVALGVAGLLPSVLPPAALAAVPAAGLGALLARSEDPLRNVAIALPALTFLALALTP